MKDKLIFRHYVVRGINAAPWIKTWNNLKDFVKDNSEQFLLMGLELELQQIELKEQSEENLKRGNMLIIASPRLMKGEEKIEDVLTMSLCFTRCNGCLTPKGDKFLCRTLKGFDGTEYQILTEELFLDVSLRIAFNLNVAKVTECTDCSKCRRGCNFNDEE